jgi:raffinose/stachyose/melibiose transport system permease protein
MLRRGGVSPNLWLFVFPALVFYVIFAIVPLAQGAWISTTNWNGTAPWVPAQIKIADFESKVLARASLDDKQLLLKYYEKNEDAGTYQKRELYGIDRYRVLAFLATTGLPNPDFSFVGLQNYLDIFTGKADPKFFPQSYTENRFQAGSPLETAQVISADEWNDNLIGHVSDARAKEFLTKAYQHLFDGSYKLDTSLFPQTETDVQLGLSQLPGLADDWEALYDQVTTLGQDGKVADLPAALAPYEKKLAAGDRSKLDVLALQTAESAYLKNILAENWHLARVKWGVLAFTGFFTVVNVVLVNLIALLLALALDTKIRSRNVLRTLFYVPNVLSMVVVAFVWQLMFTRFLPAITGISTWLQNPDLAPWLTVLVATWQGVGYYTVLYLAGLQNISAEINEVAALDGAHGWRKFRAITLPLLAPAFTICLFLSIAGALKTFDIIFALYPSTSTSLGLDNLVVNIFYDAFRDKHAGAATAKAILLLLVILGITGIQIRLTKKHEVEL